MTDFEAEAKHLKFIAHTPRTKKLRIVQYRDKNVLVSCSTDGTVRFWELDTLLPMVDELTEDKDLKAELKHSYNINTHQRLITLEAMVRKIPQEVPAGESKKSKKKKRKLLAQLQSEQEVTGLNPRSKKIKKVRIAESSEEPAIPKLKQKRLKPKSLPAKKTSKLQKKLAKTEKPAPESSAPKSILRKKKQK